jgi:hypothetical protein
LFQLRRGAFGKIKKVSKFDICKDSGITGPTYDAVVLGGGSGGLAFA